MNDFLQNIQSILQFKNATQNETQDSEEITPFLRSPQIDPYIYTSQIPQIPQIPSQIPSQVLTHRLYLDIREKEIKESPSFFNYLNFNNKSYFTNFKDSLIRSWACCKSSFYFFIQAFYPDAFQHYAPDIIIELSETILDEYSTLINNKAGLNQI